MPGIDIYATLKSKDWFCRIKEWKFKINSFFTLLFFMLEAEKVSQVAKIQYDQKIMEKESMRKMSEIEGMF